MFDTICIQSPYIDKKTAETIEQFAFKRMGVEVSTGEIVYCITTAELKGTYDSSIRIKVEHEEYRTLIDSFGKQITDKKPSEPYVIVECSLNKLVQGHNVYGGSDDFRQFQLLIKFLETEIHVQLPSWYLWTLRRLDYAVVFDLGEQRVYNYIENLSNGYYSRRKALRFGNTGFYVPGTTTTLKFYAKGKEFKKNDFKRISNFDESYIIEKELQGKIINMIQYRKTAKELQLIANNLLRVEVEIKPKKIKYDNNEKLLTLGMYVLNENENYFEKVFNDEVGKLIKLVENDVQYYTKYDDVKEILYKQFTGSYASNLLGTWLKFSLVGEESARKDMSRPTFYRHRKDLIDCKCLWNNNIVEKSDNNIIDFLPYSDSKYVFKSEVVKQANCKLINLFEKYKIS